MGGLSAGAEGVRTFHREGTLPTQKPLPRHTHVLSSKVSHRGKKHLST